MKILAQGAEAIITQTNSNTITKVRQTKSYRYPALDDKLRKLRTRQESRLLEKAHSITPVPKILKIDEQTCTLELEKIPGEKLSKNLEKLKLQKICSQIAKSVSAIHKANIIHGDLTTSNMIYSSKNAQVYMIDFGLGFHSTRDEDKAVDLHVLKEALQAKHPNIYAKAWQIIAKNYANKSALKRLQKVESRGRYKEQY